MRTQRWTACASVREAVKNVSAPSGRTRVLLAVLVLVGSAQTAFIALEWNSLQSRLEDAVERGETVLVFQQATDADQVAIEIRSCERLTRVDGVRRAGALIPAGRTDSVQFGPGIPVVRASRSLIGELAHAQAMMGAGLGQGRESRMVEVATGDIRFAIPGPWNPPGVDGNSAITLPLRSSDATTSRCVVELQRNSRARDIMPELAAQLTVTGGQVAGISTADAFDVVDAYLDRPERWAPVVVGLIGAGLGLLLARMRGSEFAAYRLTGTSAVSLLRIAIFEQLLVSGVYLLAASLSAVVLAPAFELSAAAIVWAGLACAAWLCAFTAGAVPLMLRNPTLLAKDR